MLTVPTMPALPGDLARIGGFALFVLWLTAFPMSGPLLSDNGEMTWFLWGHVFTLLACARFADGPLFRILLTAGTLATALMTVAYGQFAPAAAAPLLLLLGIASGPLLIHLLTLLKGGRRPVLLAALGMGLGNLAAIGLDLLPLAPTAKLVLLGGAWPAILFIPAPSGTPNRGPTPGLSRYLWFVLAFQLVSGLMYGQLWPAYGRTALLPGIELLVYALAVLSVVRLADRDPQLTLLLGVTTAILAFASWHLLATPLGEHAGLFAMMIAGGIVDLFLVARVLSCDNPARAAGYGMAASAAGIAMGQWLASQLGPAIQTVSFIALVVLNVAVIALVLRGRSGVARTNVSPGEAMPSLPDAIRLALSEKEHEVLLAVLRYRTYREVGEALSISESSVKTYMQRIFHKTGVFSKRQLQELLERDPTPPSTDASPPDRATVNPGAR